MLEFYQAYATHEDLMALTEELFVLLAEEVRGSRIITYEGRRVDLGSALAAAPAQGRHPGSGPGPASSPRASSAPCSTTRRP